MGVKKQFPKGEWPTRAPAEAGFNENKLRAVAEWFDQTAQSPYRVGILRSGHLITVWHKGVDLEAKRGIGSGQKTLYGCMLSIAVEEGKIGSADDRVADYFPAMMAPTKGYGPRPDRYVIPEDRDITFRQLITNTSGYLKPAERPGSRFNYQTFGMNLLTHAIEKIYGCYDPSGQTTPPGFGSLVQEKIAEPIGIQMRYNVWNFDLAPEARIDIFGNGCSISGSLNDWGRIAYLWLNMGNWDGLQVIPKVWLEEGTRTAALVKACSPKEEWCYGYAFWSNDYDQRWPGLPKDAFCASGAGYNFVWVCPSLDLIVIQNPGGGRYVGRVPSDPKEREQRTEDQYQRELGVLERIVNACV